MPQLSYHARLCALDEVMRMSVPLHRTLPHSGVMFDIDVTSKSLSAFTTFITHYPLGDAGWGLDSTHYNQNVPLPRPQPYPSRPGLNTITLITRLPHFTTVTSSQYPFRPHPTSIKPHNPLPPPSAYPGLIPTPPIDIPLSSIFIFLFLLPIPTNLTLHHLSLYRHRHPGISTRPLIPILLSVLCLLRILALSLRIAWSVNPNNTRLEITAVILSMAGIVMLYIANLLITRRWVRDYAVFGYRTLVKGFFRFWIAVVVICLVMAIVVSVNRYFTYDRAILEEFRAVALVAVTILTFIAFLPVITVGVVILGGMEDQEFIERENTRFRARSLLLVTTALLLTLEAGFRTGVMFDPRPWGQERWYHSRAAYYCLGYLLEVGVVYLLIGARVSMGFRTGEVYKGHWPGDRRPRVERWAEGVNTEGEAYGERG
ncbi:hypothetical protein B0T21DRAFT_454450 [Apiosordaria backusii]|uniref:DUF7702 domain-containing protein n=1 Tax=Apiosordaria backusii TaxID=314023 RepID=A0AA40DYZ2_9PEZI|nr:hypothetical protein B0T21DRAFT_454450 [Apiosordaria backusii]